MKRESDRRAGEEKAAEQLSSADGIGKAYDETKRYEAALKYAVEGLKNAQEINRRPIMMEGYQLLSSVYHHLGKNDSAYEYILKYNRILLN